MSPQVLPFPRPPAAHDRPAGGRFPELVAETGLGEVLRLPEAFRGRLTVLVVSFSQEQERDVAGWLPAVRRMVAGAGPAARLYRLPVVAESCLPVARRLGRCGPWHAGRPETDVLPLYVDKGGFRRALGLPGEASIHVLLLGPAGEILWRAAGPLTPAAADGLQAELHAWSRGALAVAAAG
jgi:hypothetical protein